MINDEKQIYPKEVKETLKKEKDYFLNPDGSKHYVEPPTEIKDRLKKERKSKNIDELSESLGVGHHVVRAAIDDLHEEGYGIKQEGDIMIRSKVGEERDIYDASKLIGKHFKFGVVSDIHLGSKKERLDEFNLMYDKFQSEGIKVVFNSGDITEGVNVYRGQEYETHKFGQQEQIEYAIEKYPKRKGIKTLFITGNHDLREYERGGVDVGVSIAKNRGDMEYLGQEIARVRLPNGAEAELLHPKGGSAYALSYKSQKFINNLNPEDIPEMMMWGHYHTSFYMHYRNVHFLQVPCFKGAGRWEKTMGLNPTIGGWVVEGKISDQGRVDQFKPELFRFQGAEKR